MAGLLGARRARFARCSAAFDERPDGLVEQQHAVDAPARRRGTPRAARQRRACWSAATASSISCDRRMPRLDRVVVGEVELRHRVERRAGATSSLRRKPAVRASARTVSSACSRPARCVKKHLRVRQVGATPRRAVIVTVPDARILHLVAQQLGELALDLVADALRALRMFLHVALHRLRHSTRGCATASARPRRSRRPRAGRPSAMSLKFLSDRPHSKPRLHLAHVVLEALQRIELAVVDHDVVAQQAHLRAAPHHAVEHVAAGDRADLRDLVDLAHLDQAELCSPSARASSMPDSAAFTSSTAS